MTAERVALFDAATGEEMGDYMVVSRALEAAVLARQAAEQRIREDDEARRAAERQAKEDEQRTREAIAACLAAEKAQAEMATRLKQMEEELKRLRGS